jgi:hypothetical protein
MGAVSGSKSRSCCRRRSRARRLKTCQCIKKHRPKPLPTPVSMTGKQMHDRLEVSVSFDDGAATSPAPRAALAGHGAQPGRPSPPYRGADAARQRRRAAHARPQRQAGARSSTARAAADAVTLSRACASMPQERYCQQGRGDHNQGGKHRVDSHRQLDDLRLRRRQLVPWQAGRRAAW